MIERGAGDDGEVWLRCKSIWAADDGCDCVVSSEGFSEGKGACATAGTKEKDPHIVVVVSTVSQFVEKYV